MAGRGGAKASSAKAELLPQLSFALDFGVAEPQVSAPVPAIPRYSPIVLVEPPAPLLSAPLLPTSVEEAPVAPAEPVLYTVRRLLAEVRGRVEQSYPGTLNVEGEISNCRPAASGHLYFTLKDGDAQLAVVMFRRQSQYLGFKPRDGLHVELRGRISVYESRGQLQFIADSMRPRGEGALQLAFEELKRRLAAEGLFDAGRKRPLPAFPHCIGIVTSTSGAALRDIIHVVRRRHARLNLLVYPAVVQGPSCASSVAAGVRWFNRNPGRVDLILVTRGGGSLEDLAGFNDEGLARVIAESALPVVSAVGHEIDTSIADLVADLRAPTPSAAAEMITGAQHRIAERIASLDARVRRAGQYHLLHALQRLARLSAAHVLARLRDSVSLRHRTIDELRLRLRAALIAQGTRSTRQQAARLAALEARLRRQDPAVRLASVARRVNSAEASLTRLRTSLIVRPRTRLAQAETSLHALSPLAVLNRGYAIVYAESGVILRSPEEAIPDSVIRARLAGGTLAARVVSEQATPGRG